MRPGLFIATLAGLLAVIALLFVMPVWLPGDVEAIPGGPPPLRAAAPRCLLLAFTPHDPWLPRGVRLRADIYGSATRYGYEADAVFRPHRGSRTGYSSIFYWKPAGPDSMDIVVGHHGPIARLPTGGDTLVGRAGIDRYQSMYDALAAPRSSVRAVEVRCDSLNRGWPPN